MIYDIKTSIKALVISMAISMTTFPSHAQSVPNNIIKDSIGCNDKHIFLLKTNLFADALGCPSLGFEWLWKGRFSLAADYTFGWMITTREMNYHSLHFLHTEARWYPFKPKEMNPYKLERSHHFGLYGMLATYDFMYKGKGYQAKPWTDTWGVGLSYGYRWNVNARWSLDFTIGAGYTSTRHTLYERYRDWYVRSGYDKRNWFGISKAEISLVWNINTLKYERKK